MYELLFWLFITNAILLINHEIDSAYWREWELFKLPGGITGFLLLHFPILFFVLFGLVLVTKHLTVGFLFSFILGLGGIFAFVIHTYFLKKGRTEFNTPISKIILWLILIISLFQLVVTALLFAD